MKGCARAGWVQGLDVAQRGYSHGGRGVPEPSLTPMRVRSRAMATETARCDICQTNVPPRADDETDGSYALADHQWSAHRVNGLTRCEHCGEPEETSGIAEHLALEHDLPPPANAAEHAERNARRDALRRERADDEQRDEVGELGDGVGELRDELRVFLREARAEPMPLSFASTVLAVIVGLLLLPVMAAVLVWALDLMPVVLGPLVHLLGLLMQMVSPPR